jgi:DNA-binding transcriptional LysR family regulator
MELRHLRYFCAVAEHRSFTLAAKHLHVSQSGVSGQVRDLEKEIGATLLQRSQRDVSLTPEGAVFFQQAQEILEHANRAVEMTLRASRGQLGKLTVGLCGPATAPFLPRLFRAFRKRHPEVNLALKDIDPAHQPEALINKDIDIGFTRGIPSQFRQVLGSEILFREPVIAALPRGHALASQQTIQLTQLARDRFILYARKGAPDLFDAIVALCKKAKFSPHIADNPNVWQSVLTMVEAGEGVSLIPACVRHLHSSGLVFPALAGQGCQLDVIVAWRRGEPDATRDRFLNLLRKNRIEIERSMQQP